MIYALSKIITSFILSKINGIFFLSIQCYIFNRFNIYQIRFEIIIHYSMFLASDIYKSRNVYHVIVGNRNNKSRIWTELSCKNIKIQDTKYKNVKIP